VFVVDFASFLLNPANLSETLLLPFVQGREFSRTLRVPLTFADWTAEDEWHCALTVD
jgi:hypothetical protein